jgi:hypothetical protein
MNMPRVAHITAVRSAAKGAGLLTQVQLACARKLVTSALRAAPPNL